MLSLLFLGCVAGVLSGLFGIGGGIITVPVLASYFTYHGMTPALIMPLASGTSLATMTLTTLTSSLRHHRKGAVNWHRLRFIVPGTMMGALLGVKCASLLPPIFIKTLFCCLALFVGSNMIFGRLFVGTRWATPHPAILFILGLSVGVLAGMLGVGGGVILVPLLCLFGLSLPQAAATSAACTLPTVLVGALSALWIGSGIEDRPLEAIGFIYWPAVALVGLPSIAFAWIGVELAHRLPVVLLRRIFGGVLILLVFSWLLFSS